MNTNRNHIFVTALGKVNAETIYPYQLEGKNYYAPLAPLALLEYLEENDTTDHILVLVTEGALETTWPVVQERARELDPEKIVIPDGKNEEEIKTILENVAKHIPEKVSVTLDVTQGFRHFPFILYALALYLRSLKEITIKGAYYGMLEGYARNDTKTPRPILNLEPLLELPEWFYAIRMFRETGSARALKAIIEKHSEDIHQYAKEHNNDQALHKKASPFNNLKRSLEEFSYTYESGLPIETGKIAQKIQQQLNLDFTKLLSEHLPLAGELNASINGDLEPFRSNHTGQQVFTLDEFELERQAKMIELYLQRSQLPLGIGLMREWVVSWVIFHTGNPTAWLKGEERKKAEKQLGLFGALAKDKYEDEHVREWGNFWRQLADLRNTLHHHGMREESMDFPPKKLPELTKFFNKLRMHEIAFPQFLGGKGRLLITPQGLSAGVLYSAIQRTKPDYCIIICTPQSQPTIEEAAIQAGFKGIRIPFVMNNPNQYANDEIQSFLNQNKNLVIEADEVVANLTGGTTIMGVIVQQFIEKAQHYNRPTRRFILIDSRSPEDQRSDPYQLSEITWLDKEEGVQDADH